uniref:DNA-directed RNA polymerase n=1 Tax=Heterorhabditis bacteriophora TaxID=37862 RepID=A0A1I7XM96_HETBA
MYSPFTIEKMKFTKYGGAEKTRYDSRAGTPSKIDVGDFELEKIETRSVFLIPGSKVIDSIKEISYLFALSRSPHSLAWMLLSLTVQFMNGMLLVENLPPDYVRMPTIG